MSKGLIEGIELAAGAIAIAAGIFLTGGALAVELIIAGAGLMLSGIGTMMQKGPVSGFATTTRNPIAPWEIAYGRTRIGGTIIYLAEFGDSNKWLDMVVLVAAHSSQSVDELLFDNARLQIGANNTSFTPLQQDLNINSPSYITRVGNIVTITNTQDIPLLQDGDKLYMEGIHPVSLGLNGIFQVFQVIHNPVGASGTVQFSYLAGGLPLPGTTITESGRVHTRWQDYKKNVYLESMGDSAAGSYNRLGHAQTLGETFVGMTNGTPKQGDVTTLVQNDASGNNPWTPFCSLVGFTAIHIRLEYDSSLFPSGIPQISFILRGKNDIFDPRTSTFGYSENSALCIADYLSNQKVGFKAAYSTEIDNTQLIAAANVCDERVGLAFPLTSPLTTEPRYTCCGHFNVQVKRGDVLTNLLTSCGGRVVYIGGKFFIYPAKWAGSSATFTDAWVRSNAAGPIKWRSSVSISGLFNGVKGTYISPVNNWQSSDFPRYAQDDLHGYNDGSPSYDYDLNLTNDGGDRRWLDIQLPFTISCPTAQRLAKIELRRRREQGTGTFIFNMAGYQIAPMDVITLSFSVLGWTAKTFEALATRFRIEKQTADGQDLVLIGTEVDVQESVASDYDWEIIEELSPPGYQHPGVPDYLLTPDPPSNLQISFDNLGTAFLQWTAPLDAFVTQIDGRYQPLTSPPGIWTSLVSVDDSITQMPLPPALSGGQYVVELRSENAAGVVSDWVSISYTPQPYRQKVHPNIETPSASNPLFAASDETFGLGQLYTLGKDNKWSVDLVVKTQLPVNSYIPGTDPPVIGLAESINQVGGTLIPGQAYPVCVACYDDAVMAARHYSPSSNILIVVIAPGMNAIQLSGIVWPSGTFAGYTVFAAADEPEICAQYDVSAGSPPTSLTTTTILAGPLLLSSFNMPSTVVDSVRVKASVLIKPGLFSFPAFAVGTNSVTKGHITGFDDDYTGRAITLNEKLLDDGVTPMPFLSFLITAHDIPNGIFTLTPDPVAAGIAVGDVFSISLAPTTASSTTIGDSALINEVFQVGEPTGAGTDRAGAQIIAWKQKTNQRQIRKVISNTATVYTVDSAWSPTPDPTWTFIVADGSWPFITDYAHVDNAIAGTTVTIPVRVTNQIASNWVVLLSALDIRGGETDESIVAMRIIHLIGRGNGSKTVTADYTIQPGDQIILCDTTAGPITITLPSDSGLLGQTWTVVKNSVDASTVTVIVGDVTVDLITSLGVSGTSETLSEYGGATVLVQVQ